jgi:hypothetical protein
MMAVTTWQNYQRAFDRLDVNRSGFIERSEIQSLLDQVYADAGGKAPQFEVDSFIRFFDRNRDGKISWSEFEAGLGAAMSSRTNSKSNNPRLMPAAVNNQNNDNKEDDDDEEEEEDDDEPMPLNYETNSMVANTRIAKALLTILESLYDEMEQVGSEV